MLATNFKRSPISFVSLERFPPSSSKVEEKKVDVATSSSSSSSVAIRIIPQEEIAAAQDIQEVHPWTQIQEASEREPVNLAKLRSDRAKAKAPVNKKAPDGSSWSTYSWKCEAGSTPRSTSSSTRHWTTLAPYPWREHYWAEGWQRR